MSSQVSDMALQYSVYLNGGLAELLCTGFSK